MKKLEKNEDDLCITFTLHKSEVYEHIKDLFAILKKQLDKDRHSFDLRRESKFKRYDRDFRDIKKRLKVLEGEKTEV